MTTKELAIILTPVAKEYNAIVTIPQEKQERDSLWEINAKIVENEYDGFVDWEEEFYECPYCGEPVYKEDWEIGDFDNFICPICEDVDLER